jgi:hypothetical protein
MLKHDAVLSRQQPQTFHLVGLLTTVFSLVLDLTLCRFVYHGPKVKIHS